jgi:hypothetical protein
MSSAARTHISFERFSIPSPSASATIQQSSPDWNETVTVSYSLQSSKIQCQQTPPKFRRCIRQTSLSRPNKHAVHKLGSRCVRPPPDRSDQTGHQRLDQEWYNPIRYRLFKLSETRNNVDALP